MNIYIKEIDGKKVIKPRNQIVIIGEGFQTYNPTDEMVVSDGWELYVPEEKDKTVNELKRDLIKKIEMYDSSDNVNVFYMQGKQMWLDKSTRVGLSLRFSSEQKKGLTETTLWYNGDSFTLPLETAMYLLFELEIYASESYDNTQRHISNVNKLTDKDDILSYDYTTGYPNPLYF